MDGSIYKWTNTRWQQGVRLVLKRWKANVGWHNLNQWLMLIYVIICTNRAILQVKNNKLVLPIEKIMRSTKGAQCCFFLTSLISPIF